MGGLVAVAVAIPPLSPWAIAVRSLVAGAAAATATWLVLFLCRRWLGEARSRVIAELSAVRAKQSRHEYHQEQSLARIERLSGAIRSDTELSAAMAAAPDSSQGSLRRVLMITTNGAGLGHLTRCLALARQLPESVAVDLLTLSTAAPVIEDPRVAMHYHPSRETSGLGQVAWDRSFSNTLARMVSVHRPDLVMFDGTFIYRPVHDMFKRLAIPLVWVLRGCWREGKMTRQVEDPADYVDGLLLPDDFARPGDFPVKATNLPIMIIPPLVSVDIDGAVPRAEAKAKFGLELTAHHVLIQLGAGNIDDTAPSLEAALAAVKTLGPDWNAVVVRSPIAERNAPLPTGVRAVHGYPLAQFYAAFDFVVVAAGYNSVQEVVATSTPAILVPNLATVTDDQSRRAFGAAEQGLALAASDSAQIHAAVRTLADPAARRRMRDSQRRAAAAPPLAADSLPRWLAGVLTGSPPLVGIRSTPHDASM